MDRLFKSAISVRELKPHTDDDYADRLSRFYTVSLLVCFAFLVTTMSAAVPVQRRQLNTAARHHLDRFFLFVGAPIHCWCPAQFTDSHRDYTDAVCWVSNTYYLPIERTIPGGRLDEAAAKIGYYQWVPLLLAAQAVLAFLPCQLWRFLCQSSGINLTSIMDAAKITSDASYLEVREKAVRYIVNQMDRYLIAQRDFGNGCLVRVRHFIAKVCCLVGGRNYGNYLITSYVLVKLVYAANAISQILLIAAFVGPEYRLYGLHVIGRMMRQTDWTRLEHFPRVTLCEFAIRDQSRVHQYVVQCALSINLFNEKIFVFLWFWLAFVAAVTVGDLLAWLFRALYWPGQVQYVRRRLRAFDAAQRPPAVLAKFTENYLRRDGLFIVRMIGLNVGDVAAGEVLCGLWNNYGPERRMLAERIERKRTSGGSFKAHLNGSASAAAGASDSLTRLEMV